MRRLLILSMTLALSALGLAGCSDGGGAETARKEQPQPTKQAQFNDADVDFATEMIPHHAQALVMADVALRRTGDPDLRSLAREIRDAQKPEIETMAGWLRSWGELVPPTQWHGWSMGGHGGMAHGPGMMGPGDLRDLRRGPSARFNRMWLTMMISHHEGAVYMAKVEQRAGANADAKALARRIQRTQRAEILEMQRMLDG